VVLLNRTHAGYKQKHARDLEDALVQIAPDKSTQQAHRTITPSGSIVMVVAAKVRGICRTIRARVLGGNVKVGKTFAPCVSIDGIVTSQGGVAKKKNWH